MQFGSDLLVVGLLVSGLIYNRPKESPRTKRRCRRNRHRYRSVDTVLPVDDPILPTFPTRSLSGQNRLNVSYQRKSRECGPDPGTK